MCEQLEAFREGAGPDIDILVDLNFNFKTEGFLKMARAMEPYDLFWVEIDSCSPEALAYIRRGTTIPIASGECLFRRRGYKPYLDVDSMDVADYRRAWAWVHFMLHGPPEAREELINFLKDIAAHSPPGQLSERLSRRIPDLERSFVTHFSTWRPN